MRKLVYRLLTTLAAVSLGSGVWAQSNQPLPYDEGALGLAFALRKLPVTGSFLHVTAHPDDEDNPLFVMLGRGRGLRTGLLTLTRGDGGQNEIGPELFEALGVIRTGELMALHRYDGAEQFFTRAYEFGYSFSVDETLQRWGKEEILADVVRVVRKFRPDVIVTLPRAGEGGGQHHQTSAILAAEAFRAAADPARFPEQIAEGLVPWQASKLYERSGWGDQEAAVDSTALPMETGIFDPLFGKTWAQIGAEERSLHKCQGMTQIIPLAGPYASYWKLIDAAIPVQPVEDDLFDGIDVTLLAIEKQAGAEASKVPFLRSDLAFLQEQVEAAFEAYDANDPSAVTPYLADGLKVLRQLRKKIQSSPLGDRVKDHLEFMLSNKQRDFEDAFRKSLQLTVESLADDGVVTPGQTFKLTVTVANGGSAAVESATVRLKAPKGWTIRADQPGAAPVPGGGVLERGFEVTVAGDAEFTQPYWRRDDPTVDRYRVDEKQVTRPWSVPALQAEVEFRSHGVRDVIEAVAEYRYTGPWVGGEKRHDLLVAPAVSVSVDPLVGVIPLANAGQGREVRVTAVYEGAQPASGVIEFELPEGWTAQPSSQEIQLERPGQSVTKIFKITPPEGVGVSSVQATALVKVAGQTFRQGYQVIDYDHIRRRHLYHPSAVDLKTIDVRTAPGLRVGYIDGVGDYVPEALRQLGVDLHFLKADDLAFGDLSRFDTIITGVRAYLVREDLKANNARLLDWVKAGGRLVVQYNKYEFNDRGRGDSPYAPYPAKVGNGRVTDETAPVTIRETDNPIFASPNRITAEDWAGWVQERGLYFLGEKDPRYRDLVVTADPFPYNAGEKLGSLVEAKYGEGTWLYVGLGLWRQLPAGVPGAYRLLANLLGSPGPATE